MYRNKQKTSIYYKPYNVINTVIEFIDNSSSRIDACVDYTRPSLIVEIAALKKAFVDAKERGIKLRYVTEITGDNVSYCKELVNTINIELRHVDGIKGNFYVSENEYVAPATFHHKGKPASHIIYSNVKEIVDHQQYVFESFWTRAIPAQQRIKEIEEGVIHYRTKIVDNSDEIIKEISRLTADSNELDTCLAPGGLQYSHSHFFDIKKKLLDKQKKGQHKGIRYITNIGKENIQLVKLYMERGIQIKHIKNLPSMSFGVSDKEIAVTIENMEGGTPIRSLLLSNEPLYLKHFSSTFEGLWKNGTDVMDRIREIEQGIEPSEIEIIENPREAMKRAQQIIRLAKHEVLRIYPSLNTFRRHVRIGIIDLLQEVLKNGVKVRILIPADEDQISQIVDEVVGELPQLEIRSIDKSLQTQMGVIVVDRKESLIVELRDDTKENYYDAAGLAAYSNSRPIALSYVSIFESLWKQGELYEQLKAYNIMQRDFINIAAHELRTPIQPILGLSQVVSPKVGEEEREHMRVIIRNAKRLQRLTENILDVTKIDNHSLNLQKERVNLIDLISRIVQDFRNQIDSPNLLLVCQFEEKQEDKNDLAFVRADKSRLIQVISNLLSNAIKFTKEGIISVNVEKQVKEKEKGIKQEAIITVKDMGVGIDPKLLDRLFSKFATKSFAGTGLGLFISKSIVEAHGGRIWAENNSDGRGATFIFTLPLDRISEPIDVME
ncbi:MAG TPA: ATP-binding protein [Nitrososphaeraceae archaeon]|jgi:two-component system, OmpR family, sensor histidine kinase VicK|nr:ATP-binding protein [Nitrososphaeraceae archaeon]